MILLNPFWQVFQPLQRKISLSTECTYKLGNSWKHGFHTSCEAFVYYYPYHDKMPSKCVSQPDETKVKTAIKTAFNITLPEVFIFPLKIYQQQNSECGNQWYCEYIATTNWVYEKSENDCGAFRFTESFWRHYLNWTMFLLTDRRR